MRSFWSSPSSRRRRRPYTASRCLFITSSYSDRTMPFEDLTKDPGNVIFNNEIFLVESLEQTAAQAIHRLTLLVHHVVVLRSDNAVRGSHQGSRKRNLQ